MSRKGLLEWFRLEEECPPVPPSPETPAYPRFCRRCGSPLAYECSPIGFDERTGAPRFSRWAHCPKWTGENVKRTLLGYERAAILSPDFTQRLYPTTFGFSSVVLESFYLDCDPAYEAPAAPEPAA